MPRVASIVPASSDILCESCGYTLNGLPETGNCPECGEPIRQSTDPQLRRPPAWEAAYRHRGRAFVRTTAEVIFQPKRFFRTTLTRGSLKAAHSFAIWHWLIASVLFGGAAAGHVTWFWDLGGAGGEKRLLPVLLVAWAGCFAGSMLLLLGVTHIATRLTAWEAAYRGIRLPHPTVLRGMFYHAAHYLPVGVLAFVTVFGYRWLYSAGIVSIESASMYLYVLSGEVVVSAVYLFNTYWIGMRNMMYANR